MKSRSHITKAGSWLFCASLGFAVLVCCLTQDWALSSPDGLIVHPHRIDPPAYGLLLFAGWAAGLLHPAPKAPHAADPRPRPKEMHRSFPPAPACRTEDEATPHPERRRGSVGQAWSLPA